MQLKELTNKKTTLAPGYRTCSGCPITLIVRHLLRATNDAVVVAVNTGCLEVTTTIYPQTSWKVPLIHSLLENGAATVSGLESAYRVLQKKDRLSSDKKIKFVVFGGDGSTYDAGFQFLSAAIERRHDFLYVCYDNQAYMNTGVQKSGATPIGTFTNTTPGGRKHRRKDLTKIIAAHDVPYAAQAALWHWQDLYNKAKKALEITGPTFLNILSPCVPGWKIDTDLAIELSKLAVETRFWPLYEVEQGKYKITVPVEKPKPLEEFLKPQGRFKHLLEPENQEQLAKLKDSVYGEWKKLEDLQK